MRDVSKKGTGVEYVKYIMVIEEDISHSALVDHSINFICLC